MQSFLVVAHTEHVVEELRRHVGEGLSLIPLKSMPAPLRDEPQQPVAAVMIQMPDSMASGDRPGAEASAESSLPMPDSSLTLEARVDVMERRIIEDSLRRNQQRRKETASELGISRVTLYNKMKKFGML